ncbi:AT-rich interactive domain-containing protein 4B-like isoform X1 [Pipra filicauda]|uniref:AT-rich interactive domain-containing protein 4B-like isoform X1 n=1 Tax=Pipra filicauda TaxID=649802 RepID=A0A6J2J786_9PASS|nr:AT-rich interactive domain-containing protein 4B-like isoform X1 [Pipra filicauda]
MDCRKNKTDREKEEEYSVLNTPLSVTVVESSSQSSVTVSGSLPPNQEEIQSIRSETDGTVKAHSVVAGLQDLQCEGNSCTTDFNVSVSSSSSKQPEPEHTENVFRDQKILQDAQERDSSSKKQKTSLKTSVSNQKKSKSSKCGQNRERESDLKEQDNCLPKVCKWSFQVYDLENLSSDERIAVLQARMQEIRRRYLLLKAEVAAIDRRKRLKKQRERAAAMSSSSPDGMSGECSKK